MTPETILQSDVLDILFEHRNKTYGAYELRRQYNRRLRNAIAGVYAVVIVACAFGYWRNHLSPDKQGPFLPPISDSTRLTQVEIITPPPPARLQPVVRNIAAIQDATIRIVRETEIANPPPTVDEIADKNIGPKTITGDVPGNIVQPIAAGTGHDPAPVAEAAPEKEEIVDHADIMPEFPGGMAALNRFLAKNLRMPRDDMDPGTKIRVLVKFVVDKDGSITGIETVESGGNDFDHEVLRVMNKMPKWKPGLQHGKNIAVYYKIPVIFVVPGEN